MRQAKFGSYRYHNLARVVTFSRFRNQAQIPLNLSSTWLFDYTDSGNTRNQYRFSGRAGNLSSARFDIHGIQFEYDPSSESFFPWEGKLDVPWKERKNDFWYYELDPPFD